MCCVRWRGSSQSWRLSVGERESSVIKSLWHQVYLRDDYHVSVDLSEIHEMHLKALLTILTCSAVSNSSHLEFLSVAARYLEHSSVGVERISLMLQIDKTVHTLI